MKLLLTRDVPKLGIVGDIVEVSRGYARNYLLPQRLATEPSDANMKALAEERAKSEERRRQQREQLKATADQLADVEVTIEAAANEEGHLYGSVGPREISAALRELGHSVAADQVRVREPIKRLDNVMVDVVLAEDLHAAVKVWVVRSKALLESERKGTEAEEIGEDDD